VPGPYTIDASVFLNAFNPTEEGHDTSREFLARLQREAIPIIAPTLVLPEVAGTISRGQGNADLGYQFASALARLPHLVLVSLDPQLAHAASQIAAQRGLRGSDAVYIAVAARFGSQLITLDKEQRSRTAEIVIGYSPSEAMRAF